MPQLSPLFWLMSIFYGFIIIIVMTLIYSISFIFIKKYNYFSNKNNIKFSWYW